VFWAPPIPQDLYFPIGLIFLFIGLFSLAWLVFYVENSRDLPAFDKYLGISIRLIIMAFFLGFGFFLLSFVQII
jgi:hypothetical protein